MYTGIRLMIYELIENHADILVWFTTIARYLLALLAICIVIRCFISMMSGHSIPEIWGVLTEQDSNGSKKRHPIKHWGNLIGRSPSSDININYQTVSRNHAALIRDEQGNWEVFDTLSKTGVFVNGAKVEGSAPVEMGDCLTMGGINMQLQNLTPDEQLRLNTKRSTPGIKIKSGLNLILLNQFQLIILIQLLFSAGPDFNVSIPIAFGVLLVLPWFLLLLARAFGKKGFEIETIAFFLVTLGFAVCASSEPSSLYKQLIALGIGLVVFLILCLILRNLDRAKAFRWPAAIAALALLGVTAVFGEVVNGARNWIIIGGVSIQSSEVLKVAFIYAGAATLDRLLAKRNLVLFILFTGACVATLAIMGDFGAALIFFVTFIVISFLRSGSIFAVALYLAGAGFAAFIAITMKPYIAQRFANFGHAWDFPFDAGYQQTRVMSASASGGLFGVGAGKGWLKSVFAADTDLVFGMLSEELGLIIAICAIFSIISLTIFVVKSAKNGRSTFYVIAAVAAVSMLTFQCMLNVFGALDLFPLTGVTFPFVSVGGSSLISSFGMLAFVKATDTRKDASIAIKAPQKPEALLQNYSKKEVPKK